MLLLASAVIGQTNPPLPPTGGGTIPGTNTTTGGTTGSPTTGGTGGSMGDPMRTISVPQCSGNTPKIMGYHCVASCPSYMTDAAGVCLCKPGRAMLGDKCVRLSYGTCEGMYEMQTEMIMTHQVVTCRINPMNMETQCPESCDNTTTGTCGWSLKNTRACTACPTGQVKVMTYLGPQCVAMDPNVHEAVPNKAGWARCKNSLEPDLNDLTKCLACADADCAGCEWSQMGEWKYKCSKCNNGKNVQGTACKTDCPAGSYDMMSTNQKGQMITECYDCPMGCAECKSDCNMNPVCTLCAGETAGQPSMAPKCLQMQAQGSCSTDQTVSAAGGTCANDPMMGSDKKVQKCGTKMAIWSDKWGSCSNFTTCAATMAGAVALTDYDQGDGVNKFCGCPADPAGMPQMLTSMAIPGTPTTHTCAPCTIMGSIMSATMQPLDVAANATGCFQQNNQTYVTGCKQGSAMLFNRKGCVSKMMPPMGYTIVQKPMGSSGQTVDLAVKCSEHFPGCADCDFVQGKLKCSSCKKPMTLDSNGQCTGMCPKTSQKSNMYKCGEGRKARCGPDECTDCCPTDKCVFNIWDSNSTTCSSCDDAQKVMINQNGIQKCKAEAMCTNIQGAKVVTDSADANNKKCVCDSVNGTGYAIMYDKTSDSYSCAPCTTPEQEEDGQSCKSCEYVEEMGMPKPQCVDCGDLMSSDGQCQHTCNPGQSKAEVDHDGDSSTPMIAVCKHATYEICNCMTSEEVNGKTVCKACFGNNVPNADGSECVKVDQMTNDQGMDYIFPNGTWTNDCGLGSTPNEKFICEPCNEGCGECAYVVDTSYVPMNATDMPHKYKECKKCMAKKDGHAKDYFYYKEDKMVTTSNGTDSKNTSAAFHCFEDCPKRTYNKPGSLRCMMCPAGCTGCEEKGISEKFINCTSCYDAGAIKFGLTLVNEERLQFTCNTTASQKELCLLEPSNYFDESTSKCMSCGRGCDGCDTTGNTAKCMCDPTMNSTEVVKQVNGQPKVMGCTQGSWCPKGYYFNNSTMKCEENSVSNCDMQNGTDCMQCSKGYVIKHAITFNQWINGSMLYGTCVDIAANNGAPCNADQYLNKQLMSCVPCNTEFCSECADESNTCTKCTDATKKPNYDGYCEEDCSAVGANLILDKTTGQCTMCKSGFTDIGMDQNNVTQCAKVCSQDEFAEFKNNQWVCTACGADCGGEFYRGPKCESATKCYSCKVKPGKVNKNENLATNMTSLPGTFVLEAKVCDYADCPTNCDKCIYDNSTQQSSCWDCAKGYSFDTNGDCVQGSGTQCGPNEVPSPTGICLPAPTGCESATMTPGENKTMCDKCNGTLAVEGGQCVKSCSGKARPNTNGKCYYPKHADVWGFVNHDSADPTTANKVWIWNCTNSGNKTYYASNGACVTKCPKGTKPDGIIGQCMKCDCACAECDHPVKKSFKYCTACKNGQEPKNGKCSKPASKKWTARVADTYDKITFTVDTVLKFWPEKKAVNAFSSVNIYDQPKCGEKVERFRDEQSRFKMMDKILNNKMFTPEMQVLLMDLMMNSTRTAKDFGLSMEDLKDENQVSEFEQAHKKPEEVKFDFMTYIYSHRDSLFGLTRKDQSQDKSTDFESVKTTDLKTDDESIRDVCAELLNKDSLEQLGYPTMCNFRNQAKSGSGAADQTVIEIFIFGSQLDFDKLKTCTLNQRWMEGSNTEPNYEDAVPIERPAAGLAVKMQAYYKKKASPCSDFYIDFYASSGLCGNSTIKITVDKVTKNDKAKSAYSNATAVKKTLEAIMGKQQNDLYIYANFQKTTLSDDVSEDVEVTLKAVITNCMGESDQKYEKFTLSKTGQYVEDPTIPSITSLDANRSAPIQLGVRYESCGGKRKRVMFEKCTLQCSDPTTGEMMDQGPLPGCKAPTKFPATYTDCQAEIVVAAQGESKKQTFVSQLIAPTINCDVFLYDQPNVLVRGEAQNFNLSRFNNVICPTGYDASTTTLDIQLLDAAAATLTVSGESFSLTLKAGQDFAEVVVDVKEKGTNTILGTGFLFVTGIDAPTAGNARMKIRDFGSKEQWNPEDANYIDYFLDSDNTTYLPDVTCTFAIIKCSDNTYNVKSGQRDVTSEVDVIPSDGSLTVSPGSLIKNSYYVFKQTCTAAGYQDATKRYRVSTKTNLAVTLTATANSGDTSTIFKFKVKNTFSGAKTDPAAEAVCFKGLIETTDGEDEFVDAEQSPVTLNAGTQQQTVDAMFDAGSVENGYKIRPALQCWDKNYKESVTVKVTLTVTKATADKETAAQETKAESLYNNMLSAEGDPTKTFDYCLEAGMLSEGQNSMNTTSFAGMCLDFCEQFSANRTYGADSTLDEIANDPKRQDGLQTMATHSINGALKAMENNNATDFGEDQIDKVLNCMNYRITGAGLDDAEKKARGTTSASKQKKKMKKMKPKKSFKFAQKLAKLQKKLASKKGSAGSSLNREKFNKLNMKLASAREDTLRAAAISLPAGKVRSDATADGTTTITRITPAQAKKGTKQTLKSTPTGGSKAESGIEMTKLPVELNDKVVAMVVTTTEYPQFTTNTTGDATNTTTTNTTTSPAASNTTNTTTTKARDSVEVEGATQTGATMVVVTTDSKGDTHTEPLPTVTNMTAKLYIPKTNNGTNASTNVTCKYYNETTATWDSDGIDGNGTQPTTTHFTVFTYTQPQAVPTTTTTTTTPATTSEKEDVPKRIYLHFVLYFMVFLDILMLLGFITHCIMYRRDKKRINQIKTNIKQAAPAIPVMATAMTTRTENEVKLEEMKDGDDKSEISVVPMQNKVDDDENHITANTLEDLEPEKKQSNICVFLCKSFWTSHAMLSPVCGFSHYNSRAARAIINTTALFAQFCVAGISVDFLPMGAAIPVTAIGGFLLARLFRLIYSRILRKENFCLISMFGYLLSFMMLGGLHYGVIALTLHMAKKEFGLFIWMTIMTWCIDWFIWEPISIFVQACIARSSLGKNRCVRTFINPVIVAHTL